MKQQTQKVYSNFCMFSAGFFGPVFNLHRGGVFNSGHFKATPQGQRRRWCDYTPTEVWPATPSPGGHDGMCSFGVPAANPAIAVSGTSPSAAVGAGDVEMGRK